MSSLQPASPICDAAPPCAGGHNLSRVIEWLGRPRHLAALRAGVARA